MKKGIYSTHPLFSSSETNNNNQDNDIDSKYQKRQENFMDEENFSKIKETTMTTELSSSQNNRNLIFQRKRLKKSMNSETTQTLKNNLKIPIDLFEKCNTMNVDLSKFQEIISSFRSQDISRKYMGLVGIRKLLNMQSSSPIQELIDLGIITELISLLDNSPSEFQYEALWCLASIANGTTNQTYSIVAKGGVPKIIKIMDSSIEELKDQAIWILGNLAGDSAKIRDYLIKEKVFEKLITILDSTNQPKIIKQCTWALSNFFKVRPLIPYETAKKCIKMIAKAILILPEDKEFLTDACFILYFLTENYKETIKKLLDIDIIKTIIKMLNVDAIYILINCLRIVGNIACGNANQTQLLIDWGLLNCLKKTIKNPQKQIRKETAWIISNIAAGTQKQVEILISEDFLPILIQIIKEDEEEVKKECIWAVCNLTSVNNPNYLKKILDQGILEIICFCLQIQDSKYLAVTIEALANLLSFAQKDNPDKPNPIVEKIIKMKMADYLEKLQYHPVEFIYQKTLKILETYFETEDVE